MVMVVANVKKPMLIVRHARKLTKSALMCLFLHSNARKSNDL